MRFAISFGCLLLLGCGAPKEQDIDFNSLPAATASEEAIGKSQRIQQAKRFNANARAVNERMREAFERGKKVCDNLGAAGYAQEKGCPRPKPKYVELMDETGALRD